MNVDFFSAAQQTRRQRKTRIQQTLEESHKKALLPSCHDTTRHLREIVCQPIICSQKLRLTQLEVNNPEDQTRGRNLDVFRWVCLLIKCVNMYSIRLTEDSVQITFTSLWNCHFCKSFMKKNDSSLNHPEHQSNGFTRLNTLRVT